MDETLGSIDARLAQSARTKVRAGQKPNREELGAIRRIERQVEEERRQRYYATIPQKHWVRMAGRPWKILREQAERYGLPFGGAVIDLGAVVRALHDFLAKNCRALATGAAAEGGDPMLDGPNSPALEEYRREKAIITRIQREALQRKTVTVDEMRGNLTLLSTILRNAGETLGRQYGAEAQEIVDEALDDFDGQVAEMFPAAPPRNEDAKEEVQEFKGLRV